MPSATLMAPGSAAAQAGAWPGPVCPACFPPAPGPQINRTEWGLGKGAQPVTVLSGLLLPGITHPEIRGGGPLRNNSHRPREAGLGKVGQGGGQGKQ